MNTHLKTREILAPKSIARTLRSGLAAAGLAVLLAAGAPAQETGPRSPGLMKPAGSIPGQAVTTQREARPGPAPAGGYQPLDGPAAANTSGSTGAGRQVPVPEPKVDALADTHVHLVLRVSRTGTAHVVAAAEVKEKAVLSDFLTGEFIYEVVSGAKTIAIESFPDPFHEHGLPGKGKGQEVPYVMQTSEADVIVRVPGLQLTPKDLSGLQFKIHELKPNAPRIRVTPAEVAKLVASKQATTVVKSNVTVAVLSGSTSAPKIGTPVKLTLTAPDSAGLPFQLASSFGQGPIPLDSRKLGLSVDPLFAITVFNVLPNTFAGYRGKIDTAGKASAAINLPAIAALHGITINSAFVTLSPSAPSGIHGISNTFAFVIQGK
jgi:hypothetical protein